MFITFEGIDGSGKSSQARLLAEYINTKTERSALLTREPGYGQIGHFIRTDVLEKQNDLHPATELYLYGANRIEHVAKHIRPALHKGKVVICDRYFHSTIAYQSSSGLLIRDQVHKIARLSTLGAFPDMTFFLDLDTSEVVNRVAGRDKNDKNDLLCKDDYDNLRISFLELAREFSVIHVIDADRDIDVIAEEIRRKVVESPKFQTK